MAIHHDKIGYGKLASSKEDMSEEKLLEMARLLCDSEEAEKTEKTEKAEKAEITQDLQRLPPKLISAEKKDKS